MRRYKSCLLIARLLIGGDTWEEYQHIESRRKEGLNCNG
jgi:hypothetical protein